MGQKLSPKPLRRPYSGIYSPDDAAVFLRATTPPLNQPLNRWENQRKVFVGPSTRHIYAWVRESMNGQTAKGRNVVLTFEELIRARMIVLFRTRGLPLRAILDSEARVRVVTRKPQPFITEDFWSSSSDMFYEFERHIRVATRPDQMVMDDIVREFMTPIHHGLSFDASGLSVAWRPLPGILIDPELQLGSPCIQGTRIETESIWSFRQTGTTSTQLAELFKVTEPEIEAALAWEDILARAA